MYNLVKHKDFAGRDLFIIDDAPDKMNSPHKIGDDLFIETNRSAIDILNYCKIICNHYQLADEVYFVLGRRWGTYSVYYNILLLT